MTAKKSAAKSAKKSAKKSGTTTGTTNAKTASKTSAKQDAFAKGDQVVWNTPQGETHGVVEKKLTSPMTIKGHKVAAAPDNPEYLVKSDKSGAEAAHKPSSLKKRRGQ